MKKLITLTISLAVFSLLIYAQPAWQQIPGKATDIGVGPNGAVWVIGTDSQPGGGSIFRLDQATNKWIKVAGSALKVSVDSEGNAWVVNLAGNIFRFNNGQWEKMPGLAIDIGVGADDSIWVIGQAAAGGNGGIFRWNRQTWERVDGAATAIAVAKDGTPWVVTTINEIFRRENNRWIKVGSSVLDVGTGADGSVWATLISGDIVKWNGSGWDKVPGKAIKIAADQRGNPWAINANYDIFSSRPAAMGAATTGNSKQIIFAPGSKSASEKTTLAADGSINYIVSAKQWNLLHFTVTGMYTDGSDAQGLTIKLTKAGVKKALAEPSPGEEVEYQYDSDGDRIITVSNPGSLRANIKLNVSINR